MKPDDEYDESDVATFNEALARRDAGNMAEAIAILEKLAARRPRKASVVGVLAGLQRQAGDYEASVLNGRRATELAPRSEMASVNLFHALYHLGEIDGAFRELARFRSTKHSPEYEQMLMEIEEEALRALQEHPLDSFQKRVFELARAELKVRPIKQ